MTDWKETTLGEIAIIKGGKRLPLGDTLQRERSSHPYIKVTNVSGNTINGVDEYVPDSVFEKIKRYTVDSGDIILSIVGTIGLVGKVPEYLHKASLTENCVKILPNESLNSDYLFYFLSSRNGQAEISKNTVGAVQPKLPIYGVQNISLLLPPIEEQKEIAGVLSGLDDKIELLREENKTLEATARAIFREWFVNFNFPDAEGKPYKSSGGRMIDSELGEIPEGWRVGIASDIASITIGRTPPRKESKWFSLNPNDVKWISIKDMGSCGVYIGETAEYLTEDAVDRFNIPVIPEDTVVLSFKMTVGRVSITTERMLSNEAIAHFRLKDDGLITEYMYLFLKNFDFSNLGSTSSIVDATNSTAIKMLPILIPEKSIIDYFQLTISPVFQKIFTNSRQIKTLSTLRDTLLPKLMSGDLKIQI